ncbi:MAG: VWA domain-containing protein [Bacteroidia bacterium]|nr:VWA domain-containing protein [Bacteroidia bacterium]
MIRLEHPEYLILLILPLGVAGLYGWFMGARRRALRRMGDIRLIDRLAPARSRYRHIWRFLLAVTALTALILSLANPQIGAGTETTRREGIDLLLALDISRSMQAEDERPSRMLRARQWALRLLDKMENDRIGLMLFAGSAYVQAPITPDHATVRAFLAQAGPDLAENQGSSLASVIRAADKMYERTGSGQRALLIVSDGEDHAGQALEAAREAAQRGLIVYTVSVGSSAGAMIPLVKDGRQVGFKTDAGGQNVITQANENLLREIAAATGGMSVRATAGAGEMNDLLRAFSRLEKQSFQSRNYDEYQDLFQVFVALALICLVAEYLIPEKNNQDESHVELV